MINPSPTNLEIKSTSDTGTVGDNITTSQTPTFIGTGEEGSKITLLNGNVILGTTIADWSDGSWEITSSELPPGSYSLKAISEDISWDQVGDTVNGQAANDYAGESVSISANGDVISIGSAGYGANGQGIVSISENFGNQWVSSGSFQGENSNENLYTTSLSADGNTIAVGSPSYDKDTTNVIYWKHNNHAENKGHNWILDPNWNRQSGNDLYNDDITQYEEEFRQDFTTDHYGNDIKATIESAGNITLKVDRNRKYWIEGDNDELIPMKRWGNQIGDNSYSGWTIIGAERVNGNNETIWINESRPNERLVNTMTDAWDRDWSVPSDYWVSGISLQDKSNEFGQNLSSLDKNTLRTIESSGDISLKIDVNGRMLVEEQNGAVKVVKWGRNQAQHGFYDAPSSGWRMLGADTVRSNIDDNDGLVRVYERGKTDDPWIQKGDSIIGDKDATGFRQSLSNDGNVLAVSSRFDENKKGSVQIYKFINNEWAVDSDFYGDSQDDFLGQSLSLSGDGKTLAIGSVGSDLYDQNDFGSVKIFSERSGTWSKLGNTIYGNDSGDNAGFSVSITDKILDAADKP